jgi:uncharacterized repeat protein (TIGR01451 family)
MNSLNVPMKHAALALLVLSGAALLPQAQAAGTPASTSITNRATISYSVGGAAQTPIESSPTGNSNPGTNNGAPTAFVVDNKVDLTVTEVAGAATVVTPGQANAVATFLVTNTGNAPQAYQLTAANLASGTLFGNADSAEVANLRVFVDGNDNGTYEASDTATSISTLAADLDVAVFIVADVPVTVTNAQFANVRLTAATAVNNTPATLLVQSTGADNPASVEIVFADGTSAGGDAARNGRQAADDQYAAQSAALSVLKASTVVSDPFNGTTDPKAIPGATVEYAVTVTNTGAIAATGLSIADPLPVNTAFVQNAYSSGTRDVQLSVGATNTFCIAEAAGTDTNADGCVRTAGGALQVGAPALGAVAVGAANAVTVRFRVTIN